jgi:hypothetical protein
MQAEHVQGTVDAMQRSLARSQARETKPAGHPRSLESSGVKDFYLPSLLLSRKLNPQHSFFDKIY